MSENKSDEKDSKLVPVKPEDKKVKAQKKDDKSDKTGKKKEPISASKIFAMIIIALITIALIGTSVIYVILPQMNKSNKLSFGSYNGEEILYEQNSTLYNQYSSLAQQYPDSASSSDLSTQYQLWNQAYQNSVILTAVALIAKESDVRAPQELVDKAILESGYYNDDDGKFSETKYNETTNDVKTSLNLSYKSQVPFAIISGDEATVATPTAEKDFVASLASATRTFEYIAIDYNAIPDSVAAEYLAADPAKFNSITISDITATSEDNINKAYEALQSGTAWNDVVSQYSEDSYASSNGSIGELYYYTLEAACTAEQLDTLFSTEVGAYTAPMASSGAYRIFRVDAAPVTADISSATTKANVKYYIVENETEIASPYIEEMSAKVYEQAQTDFDEAALSNSLQTVTVNATPGNIGGSSYMGSFSYTDSYGLLSTAAADEAVMKTLYTEAVGYITEPIKSGNNYIVVKITGDTQDLSQGQTVNLFYSYYGTQMAQNDFYSNILNSDKHTNNFFTQFLNIFGGSLATTGTASTTTEAASN